MPTVPNIDAANDESGQEKRRLYAADLTPAAPTQEPKTPRLYATDLTREPPTRAAILHSEQYTPEQFVSAENAGKLLGVPTDVAARNPQDIRRIAEQQYVDNLRRSSPDLADWLVRNNNLTVAQGDVGTLGNLAQTFQTANNYAAAPVRGINQGVGSAVAGLGHLLDAGAYGLARLTGSAEDAEAYMQEAGESYANPANWLRSFGQFIKEGGLAQKGLRFAMDNSPVEALREMRTPLEDVPAAERNLGIDVVEGLGNMGAQAAVSVLNAPAGIAMLLGQGADQQAQMAQEAGQLGTGESYAAIAASAPVAAALEKIGLSRVLKYAPPGVKNSIGRYIFDKLAAAGVEATTEAAEQVTYNALANLYTDQSLGEGVTDSFTVGGAVGGIARILVGARYARTRAEREGEVLDVLGDASKASALRQRDPARFRQLVDQLAAKGADRVYLNAEQAAQYFQSAALDPATLGIDADAMAEAVALGGDVTIPMADWLTTVAPDHGEALGKFARLTPAGMDRAELETFDEEVDGAALRFLDSVYEAEQGQGAVRDVYNDVLGQQLANGTPQAEAEAQATLIQRAFDYLGGPGDGAWNLYQQYGLRIVQERPELVEALSRRPNIEAAIDSLIDRLRTGDYPKDDRVSLADFLAEGGGVTDRQLTGEIATLAENDRVVRKGKKRLVRADATRDLDRAREAAAESGYLSDDTDINDLLALLDEEMSGRPVYARGEESTQAVETRQAMESLAEELERLGIDLANTSNEDIKRALFDGGMLDQSGGDGSQSNPLPASEMDTAPVGAWVRAGFSLNGREPIYQVREVPLGDLILPEVDSAGRVSADRESFVRDYTDRAKAGEQAPNARGLELDDGRVRLQDGHRRALAARAAGRETLRVAVSPASDPHVESFDQPAFHGTPHTVDRFSLQKIGSGEGVQAYGWGLYFASKRGVAEHYRAVLGKATEETEALRPQVREILQANDLLGFDTAGEAMAAIRSHADWNDRWEVDTPQQAEVLEQYRRSFGSLYQVDVPEDADLIDYDAPLRDQSPAVIAALEPYITDAAARRKASAARRMNSDEARASVMRDLGKQAYHDLVRQKGSPRAASEYLQSLGVPGLRYLDGASRGQGEGSHNYVIWDEAAISEPTRLYQSATDQTQTPEFKRWFGDSKVVDANGEPLVVYHGTGADFDAFDKNKTMDSAFWFSSSRDEVERGGAGAASRNRIVEAYLSIKNPAGWDQYEALTYDQLIQAGHDGVALDMGDGRTHFIAFEPEQIKSATANSGAFDPSNPSILAQDGRMSRRGFIQWAADRQFSIGLTPNADRSTFFHEAGHFLLEVMADIAADPNGDPAIKADMAAVDAWLGREPSTDGKRAPITVDQHEQFARGFEKYLAEGKAPTPEMTGMFARIRAWMIEVYKTLSALNVELSDDVRGVFDRMIAGDRAIQRAETAAGMEPLVKEARALGWSDTRFAEYLRLMREGHEEAEARMASRAIEEVAREHKQWWKEESAGVQRQVEAELYAEPVYQAWSNLQFGTQPDGSPLPEGVKAVKLDKQWLLDRYGQEFLNKNLLRKQVYAVEGGVNPDMFAVTYGFADGNALVSALANALPLQKAVKAETQSRMRERHGDMRMDPQLPEQAARSIHNSKTMKAIELEVAALEELTGTPKMSPAAVRDWARRKVAGTRVRDLTPYQYLRAERKHAREAVVAAGKGDMVGALTASRRRLANATLYAEAAKARDQAEKRAKWLRSQAKKGPQERLGKAGVIYRDSVNDVLASLGLRLPTAGELARKKPLRQSVDALHEQGNEVAVAESVILRVDAGRVVDPRELTVTEFTEAYEAVKSLKHVAGQQNKLLATETKKTRDEAIAEMVGRAEEVLPDRLPEVLSSRDRTTVQVATDKVGKLFGEMDRPENVIEALDGGESGPWHTYYWGALDRAEAAGMAYRRKLATALRDLRKSMPRDFMADLGADVTLPFGPRVSRNTLIGIVLNTGNATNLQRLKNGGIHYQGKPLTLTDQQVQALRDLLTPDEARYVQGLWDTVNSLWPDIVTLQTEMTGIPPEKVEAQAFTAGGTAMRGGYWPLVYDNAKSDVGERQSDDDAMRLLMGQGYSRAVTPKGYTKTRVENVNAALQLDFGTVMSRHLDNVMTDLAYRKAVKDITAFMRNPAIKDAIIGRLGQTAYDNLKGALAYSVSPSDLTAQAAGMWRSFQGKIISNAAVSALAIRPDIALGNYASALVQATDRTGIRALSRGWWEFNTRRTLTTAQIVDLSPFMAGRLQDIDHHYAQEIGQTQGRRGYGPAYKRVMMTLHRWADHDVTRAAWWGRYKNELDKGASKAEAIRLADAMIRQTQTASGRKDLSPLERDPAFRESRMFMGPMFVIMGRMRAAARGEGATRQVGQRAASLMLQVMVAPSIFMLAAGRWPEDEDDDEEIGAGEWAWWLARNTFLFPMQAMPIVREAGASIEALLTDRPINPRAAPTAQAAAGLVKSSREIARNIENYQDTGEMDWTEMTRDLLVGVGPLTGLPSSQVRITTRTVDAIQDDPDREADEFARMAIYGPPKE